MVIGIRSAQEAVAWMKALATRTLTVAELRDSKIGIDVNEWRKHPEPHIARLAASLLSGWKRTWREAERAGA